MNSELEVQRNYWDKTVEDFDSIYTHRKGIFSNWLDKRFRWDMYARFKYTMQKSQPIEGKSVLDVGCGTGLYSLEFIKQGARKVTGIDISPNMINVCKRRFADANYLNRSEFFTGDLLSFNELNKYDIIIGIGLFDYIQDPFNVLKKMCELSSDKVIMSFPRSSTLRALIRKIRLWIKGCPVYFFSRDQLDRLLKDAGFVRYESEIIGQLFCITAYVHH